MRNVSLSLMLVLLGCSFLLGQSQYKVLWTFAGPPNDGNVPKSPLVFDKAGNLYGTTEGGGNSTAEICEGGGCGTVFRLSPNQDGSWTNTILYNFCTKYVDHHCKDGAYPQAGLILGSQGKLYGMTVNGGAVDCPSTTLGCGTVFELSFRGGSWTERVLYSFCMSNVNGQCLDGALPHGQLTLDSSRNLYGTTEDGGTAVYDAGTVFELSHGGSGWTETVLYSFCSLGQAGICPDGAGPQAGVTFDKAGNLYGTTEFGGTNNVHGEGTVFKLSPGANGWTEAVLHSFHQGGDGAGPLGGVSFDTLGNLYGTFSGGGPDFAGGVFRIPAKNEKIESFFFNGTDGNKPSASVLVDSKHATVYTTTTLGGTGNGGTVFEATAAGEESVLYSFCSQPNCTDGASPVASVISDADGNLYGTADQGGANDLGVVFEIVQQASKASASQATLKSPHDEKH
jgi:uncharacterized repeat protein (TIGR03803 family)